MVCFHYNIINIAVSVHQNNILDKVGFWCLDLHGIAIGIETGFYYLATDNATDTDYDIETDPGTDTNAAEPEGVDTVDGSSLASWDTAEQSVISRSEVTWPDYSSVPFESYHPIAYNTIPHHILGHHSNPPPHSRPT